MKLGIVTEYYYPTLGGITEHVHHFACEAKKMGHEVVIITSNARSSVIPAKLVPAGSKQGAGIQCKRSGFPLTTAGMTEDIPVIKIGKSVPLYSNGSIARVTVGFNLGRKVKEIIKSEKFDIIHIHSPFVPTLPFFMQRYSDTITVGTFHTHFSSSGFLRIYKRWVKKYFDGLDGRIAVSKLCVESIGRYFKGDYRVIPNGVDIVNFNPAREKVQRFNDGKLNVFFLSRLEPRNGLEYLIKAFGMIRKERADCRLIIGGDGPMMAYYKSLVPKHAKEDVHFVGRIDGERPNYYSTADIFCFPTTKASFGITILEAMASGKPVVAFSMPAYEAMIRSGEDGILCGEPDAENLSKAILKLMGSKEERLRIGTNARIKAEDFSWTKVARQVVDYYEEIKKNF